MATEQTSPGTFAAPYFRVLKRTSAGNADRSERGNSPRLLTTDDPTGLTGLNPSSLVLDFSAGELYVASAAGAPVKVLVTDATATLSSLDLDGAADALILDADGDTTISAPTDDQIDVEIAGADDFRFTADAFTALSGSVIQTDTIDETTSAAGVTIDGLLVKDGSSIAAVADPGDAAAIPVTKSASIAFTTGGSGETGSLAAPAAAGIMLSLTLDVDGGGDRVVTSAVAVNAAGNTSLTFADAGDHLALIGVQVGGSLVWRVLANDGVVLA